jgi:hypothetical protein
MKTPIGAIVLECDCCPNTLDTERNQWADAWTLAKDKGWAAWQDDAGTWQRFCPRCAEEIEKEFERE